MLFSTVFTWLLVAAAFVLALPALWILAAGLWPDRTQRLRRLAERGLLRSFFCGLPVLIAGIAVISVLSKLPKMGAVAALLGGVLLTWGLLGVGGTAALLGERLWPLAEPWRQVKHGGLTLVCVALLPVVGWFVLLPLLAVIGAGLQVRALFGGGKISAAPLTTPSA